MLNLEAASMLLKDLEEPPLYATIVLVADELGPIPETIRSRCQLVPFRRLSERAVRDWLGVNAPDLGEIEATSIARVAGGRLDRARRLIDPEVRERRAAIIAAARGPYLDPEFEPADASRALLDAVAHRGTIAKDKEEAVVAGLDLTPKEAEQRIKRVQRGAEREEMLAQLDEIAAWYRDLVVVASGAESATIHADRLDDLRSDVGARPRTRPGAGGGARAAGVAVGRGVQRQHRALARRALRAASPLVRLSPISRASAHATALHA